MTIANIVTQIPDLLTAIGACSTGLALLIKSVRRESDRKPVK